METPPSRMALSLEVAVSVTKERTVVESITAIPDQEEDSPKTRDWYRTSPGQLLLSQPVCPLVATGQGVTLLP